MKMRRFLFALLLWAPLAQAHDVDRAERAAWAVAEVLLAADLAGVCPHFVYTARPGDGNALLSDALVTIINETDLTMQDFAAASQLYTAADINRIKRWLLLRDHVEIGSQRARCFYARRIAQTDHATGRFLMLR